MNWPAATGRSGARRAPPPTVAGGYRSHPEFAALFDGFELVDPGVVYAASWHPDGPDDTSYKTDLAAVGRKP
ncbi:SAM-dependent methyltransferase [Nocardia sp. alder85J]|uniref:SAM-dependent methyltransferase n=1 Tax=Nocardia sp. alder85J TaxID=2862949 RepID=UPI001CD603B7|nr:SAM-dependent methyltransferase [Nocardia sp. alder85J]MCX4094429.1 SAM-dependent methyltransferase [Nocardia sp. alder85J]